MKKRGLQNVFVTPFSLGAKKLACLYSIATITCTSKIVNYGEKLITVNATNAPNTVIAMHAYDKIGLRQKFKTDSCL